MRVAIWDLPTRLFHWSLVILIPAAWWTAEEEMLEQHQVIGLITFGLILFRLLWGFLGSSTARFTGFVRGPRGVISYLSGRAPHVLGHNPLGGWSVVALLAMLFVQVGLGLFATDEDGLDPGPLSHLVSSDASEQIAELHEASFNVLLALIAIHVAAILFYALVRRKNLVRPMLTGRTEATEDATEMQAAPAWRFGLAAVFAVGLAWWIGSGLAL